MSEHEFLEERRNALEEAFFAKRDRELIKRRKREQETDDLRQASGIQDTALLEKLQSVGMTKDTIAALGLVPMVEVAWATRRIEPDERKAILEVAYNSGIDEDSPAHQLLDSWLETPPTPDLLASWKEYVGALLVQLAPEHRAKLEADVMGRARKVAEAAGGVLGIGSISGKEQDKLFELEKAFRPEE